MPPEAEVLNRWLATDAGEWGADAMAVIERHFVEAASGVDADLVRRHMHTSEAALVSGIGVLARFGLLELNGDAFRRAALALARLRPRDVLAALGAADEPRRRRAGRDVLEVLLLSRERAVREGALAIAAGMVPS